MHRIHADFLQTQTSTGRVVVQNPCLQTLPHPVTFPVSETTSVTVNVRNAVVAASGCVLVSADYSQLEIRLMAHFSRDPSLQQILCNGGDVFRQIASKWLHKQEHEVTGDDRQTTKRLCYGILYGMGISQRRCSLIHH